MNNAQAQTLYNGVGHIPAGYQQTWTEAGLLDDMRTITNREVFVVDIAAADHDTEVSNAISAANTFIGTTTDRMAIIYFNEGTYYFDTPITLANPSHNIVFQGADSD